MTTTDSAKRAGARAFRRPPSAAAVPPARLAESVVATRRAPLLRTRLLAEPNVPALAGALAQVLARLIEADRGGDAPPEMEEPQP